MDQENSTIAKVHLDNNPLFSTRLIEKAMNYAVQCHAETNHFLSDGKPYFVHLQLVYNFGCQFANLLNPTDVEFALAGCWVHDTIEDCRQTYSDVKNELGIEVAEIAYAVTNEKGKNRKERANAKYYQGIRQIPAARFVKVCDRLANIYYSTKNGSRMLEVYRKEHEYFCKEMQAEELKPMFDMLADLLK